MIVVRLQFGFLANCKLLRTLLQSPVTSCPGEKRLANISLRVECYSLVNYTSRFGSFCGSAIFTEIGQDHYKTLEKL